MRFQECGMKKRLDDRWILCGNLVSASASDGKGGMRRSDRNNRGYDAEEQHNCVVRPWFSSFEDEGLGVASVIFTRQGWEPSKQCAGTVEAPEQDCLRPGEAHAKWTGGGRC